ncbi:hypothetical protein ID866_10814, partial [Astraeus odoratus]
SPDGRWIVSGSSDNTIRLWDAHTSSQIGSPFEGHTGSVDAAAFSPDGRWIVSGSSDNTIRLWDAHIGSQIGSPLEGHTDYVQAVAFSPDGNRQWIVSGSYDTTVRVWDVHTGSQIGSPFEEHTSSVFSVAFSPDGKWIVSGSNDKIIRLWDAHTGSQIGSPFEGHTSGVWSVAFSPNVAHSLGNVHGLYGGIDCDAVKDLRDMVKLNKDGWIMGPNGKLLLWVPGHYHAFIYSPRNSLVIPRGHVELDLSMMVHGYEWNNCYIRK